MVNVPSASDFKTRYPEFTGVSDELVTEIIMTEAKNMVDDGWEEYDQKPAIMALAAHLLSMEGYPRRANLPPGAPLPAGSGREMTSRKVGDVAVTYSETASGSLGSGGGLLSSLGLTIYGRRFAQLLKLNAPAIGLV